VDYTALYATIVAFALAGGLVLELRLLQRADRAPAEVAPRQTVDVIDWPTESHLRWASAEVPDEMRTTVRVPPYITDPAYAA